MKSILFLFFFFGSYLAGAQKILTLQECYERAEANYPLIRQRDLIRQTETFSVANAATARLPQVTLGGQATYQSEVTRVPADIPGVEPLSKDQYRVVGEISQTLYQGGLVSERVRLEKLNIDVDEAKLAVEMYQIRNRINNLFFGILLTEAQVTQARLVSADLQHALKRIEASITNGTAIRSSADVLRAELQLVDQKILEIESSNASFRRMLGLFLNDTVDQGTVIQKPAFADPLRGIDRPELSLFELRKRTLEQNNQVLSATKKPRLELFVQGGYGRPGLNMLENEFSLYYLGGIRVSWILSGYYNYRREKALFDLRRQSVEAEQQTFLFNTTLAMTEQEQEIAKLRRLIAADRTIISLRTKVRQTASVQLDEGVITSTDFVREVNAEDQAKQNMVLHETQLLLAQARLQFTSGQ